MAKPDRADEPPAIERPRDARRRVLDDAAARSDRRDRAGVSLLRELGVVSFWVDGPDIARLRDKFYALGTPLQYMSVRWTSDGSLAADSYFVEPDRCTSYHYEPGWVSLPTSEELLGGSAVGANERWYEIRCA